jgi:hypothetical protein
VIRNKHGTKKEQQSVTLAVTRSRLDFKNSIHQNNSDPEVITIKNVTQYTQYTVGDIVSFPDSHGSLLSQLKSFSQMNFQRIYTTRFFWAKELNVSEKTIQRWETEIIDNLFLLGYKQPKRKNLLDDYQRFILSLIWVLKTQRKMTYQQIIEFMKSPHGQPFWLSVTRNAFSQIQSTYSRKAG